MTVSEAARSFKDGEFPDENGFIFGIDMSPDNNIQPDDFTAAAEGVFSVSARLSPRTVIRDYVDGDRAVPVSEWAEIKLGFFIVKGDAVQERILSAAKAGVPLRCVYMSCGGAAFLGNMLVSLSDISKGDICGMRVTAVFSAC